MESQNRLKWAAIGGTFVALLDFFACVMMAASPRPTAMITALGVVLASEMVLIALAIYQWSVFLKAHIAFEVDKRVRLRLPSPDRRPDTDDAPPPE